MEVSRTFENKSTYKKYDKVILHNPKPAADPATPVGPSVTEPTIDPGFVPEQPAPSNSGLTLG